MPAAAAPATTAAPAVDEPVIVSLVSFPWNHLVTKTSQQDKPKEKTVFNFTLESFEAASKPKVIREVKALVPNLTLMDVRNFNSHFTVIDIRTLSAGQETCRISSESVKGECLKRRRREAKEGIRKHRCSRETRVTLHEDLISSHYKA